mmetsp:Transcript_6349/g.14367  ORF Transcript_6349/g.14367 Transcript_6349/m.14367 type:complete len:443 (+) Transcript_6349:938-2266(+)
MKRVTSYIQILIGMGLGLAFAILSARLGWSTSFTIHYIKPFGLVFLNSLKMVAIPLIFVSLVVGIVSIENVAKLSRIGGKTLLIYTFTTVLAVAIGILIANYIKPGQIIAESTRDRLMSLYTGVAERHGATAQTMQQQKAPLQFLMDLIPENIVASMSKNENLLQVVLVAIFFGVALLKIPRRKNRPVVLLFEGINEAIIELIRFIMQLAPVGVFSLVASLLVEVTGDSDPNEIFEILYALLWYVITVTTGLAFMTFIIYPMMLKFFTNMSYVYFFRGINPAQLVAFTTSSSAASLPVVMERAEKNLGIPEEITNFVFPLGATINMDGTALYQGAAIVFIAQALGLDLSITAQLMIVTHVVISSLGVAGVPGGAMVTTMMLLQSLGIPAGGLSLILAPDRILDMCRTVTNVTGDAAVAVLIASSEGKLIGKQKKIEEVEKIE